MPVPLLLNSGSGMVLAIEDNGWDAVFKPSIVAGGGDNFGDQAPAATATSSRWPALQISLPASVYAGAPYVRQFVSGETVLAVQSGDGRRVPGSMTFSRMMVYVGDAQARNFGSPTEPFAVPPDANGLWNSLFIKNTDTVTAISATTIGGVRGLWAIDGRLTYAGQ
jgi:hypothetical protein